MRISIAAGLLGVFLGFAPVYADQCSGTIRSLDSQTVFISTPQGVFAVPANSATFTVYGSRVYLSQLRPGLPVTAFAPVITPVSRQHFYIRTDDGDDDRGRGHHRGRGKGKGKGRR